MRVAIELDIDVGDTPYDDAVSYFVHQYGTSVGEPLTLDIVEYVVLDLIANDLAEAFEAAGIYRTWSVVAAHVKEQS
jgi:hypothetical protein